MKEQILTEANSLLVEKGFNAFSYKNITKKIDIKTSSIHYYFPTKSDLGIAIIQKHQQAFEQTIAKTNGKTPLEKISKLFLYYKRLVAEQKVCIVGALTSDINTLDEPLRQELLTFSDAIIKWTVSILQDGQTQKVFKPLSNAQLKAKQIIASLMALVQFARIEKNKTDFDLMTQMILDELKIND
ncbi:MAG: TetR/AcrR family transcriptional regulator [Bacteroidia bacterium]